MEDSKSEVRRKMCNVRSDRYREMEGIGRKGGEAR
jgi:hypothetical protein